MLANSFPHSIVVPNNIYSALVFCSCLMLSVIEGEGMLISNVLNRVEGTTVSLVTVVCSLLLVDNIYNAVPSQGWHIKARLQKLK